MVFLGWVKAYDGICKIQVSFQFPADFKNSGLGRCDRLCGLVVRVPGYRSRGPGSIPRTTRFSEK
jgi:hypothetical protein